MNDDVSSLQSSHTHSHLHEDVSMWNLSYDCHAIKNRKNRKKIRIELSLLILSFYKETFIFPGTHTQTMRGCKEDDDDDATVDDKK